MKILNVILGLNLILFVNCSSMNTTTKPNIRNSNVKYSAKNKDNYNGQMLEYFENSKIHRIKNYVSGKLDGICIEFGEGNCIKVMKFYKKGLLEKAVSYNESGQVIAEVKNGNGILLIQNSNGYEVERSKYIDGLEISKHTKYWWGDKIAEENYFKEGTLIIKIIYDHLNNPKTFKVYNYFAYNMDGELHGECKFYRYDKEGKLINSIIKLYKNGVLIEEKQHNKNELVKKIKYSDDYTKTIEYENGKEKTIKISYVVKREKMKVIKWENGKKIIFVDERFNEKEIYPEKPLSMRVIIHRQYLEEMGLLKAKIIKEEWFYKDNGKIIKARIRP